MASPVTFTLGTLKFNLILLSKSNCQNCVLPTHGLLDSGPQKYLVWGSSLS